MLSWEEGDIYFWSWKGPSANMAYHCLSRKAVVIKTSAILALVDTYWGGGGGGGGGYRMWSEENAKCHLILEFKGNKKDLVPIQPYWIDYYEPEDIVDMRHSNKSSAEVYRRKDAKRSKERMLDQIAKRRNELARNIESINWRMSDLSQAEDRILAGDDLEGIVL